MGYVTASVKTNSVLDVLKTIKGMLKTGWTLDEENQILWKDSPAAFPVGLGIYQSGSNAYVTPCVKNAAGSVSNNNTTSYSYRINSTVTEYYIYVYTSPNGSIFIDITDDTAAAGEGRFGFIKNSTTDSALPSYIPIYRRNVDGAGALVPGTGLTTLVAAPSYVKLGLNYVLCNAVDPHTGTAFKDLYFLAAKTSTTPPHILTNGSYKFVRFRYYSSDNGIYYLRYE